MEHRFGAFSWLLACAPVLFFLSFSCGEEGGGRDAFEIPEIAADGWRCASESDIKCSDGMLLFCERAGEFLELRWRDCAAEGLICIATPPMGCVLCRPGERTCENQDVYECAGNGGSRIYVETCDTARGEACIEGHCRVGCDEAARWKSNVGCEYYAVDLDNAVAEADASAQQFAVVVSNPGVIEAVVTFEINEAKVGENPRIEVVDERVVPPMDLEVFELERREVDGSSQTGRNDGTGSAFTANAYRIRSTSPIVAYQFNPLDNVDVFSNDASILIPTTACGDEYVVLGWPQTIYEPYFSTNLRAFITIVGIEFETRVRLRFPLDENLRILGDGGMIYEMAGGDEFEATIGPFEVLNLETNGFKGDFTGTLIESSKAVVVFSGSEASDVPAYEDLSTRLCCADHLEQQLYAVNRNGRKYVAAVTPLRTLAVKMAGGDVTVHDEKEYFKIMGLYDSTTITTTLPPPNDVLLLGRGRSVVIETTIDFIAAADRPVSLGQFVASQNATGIERRLPGGDPAFVMVPPVEQWRKGYVFLTPSLYAFDFIIVTHTPSAEIGLDGGPFPPSCESSPVPGAEAEFVVTRCQLSFPEIVEGLIPEILPGNQDDGVHEISSDQPVGIVVYGFDRYVSYGYPGGTDLRIIE